MRKVIAISVGEPAGIGPDLVVKLAQRPLPADLMVIADPNLLLARAKQLGLKLKLTDSPTQQAGELWVNPIQIKAPVTPGQLDPANAAYVLQGIKLATELCLQQQVDAMVTGPVHKGIINQAGIAFSGHTEYLADLCGVKQVVMLLTSGNLRVALVTTHLPLAQVAAAITPEKVANTIRIVHQALCDKFAMTNPAIAICGLNPHAGENGHMGQEEINILQPVIQQLRREGMNLSEPLPADTVFNQTIRANYDAIIAMYHDQGLAPFKALAFSEGVNVTLGLPIIRTSVDHGTALSLAGSGKADDSSLLAAIELANDLALKRGTHAIRR